MPGLCSYAAIRDNHSMMLAPTARAGIIAGNPVREDIDEAGGLIGIDFIFNVLLDEDKRIIRAVAGHYLEAHSAGAAAYDARCDLRIPEAADVVIASPGGAPKDINLYQAQKTLDNVAGAVRDGGVIVLVARCREGFGNKVVRGVDDGHGHAAGAHRPHPAGVRARRPQGGRGRRAAGEGGRLPRLRVPGRGRAQHVHDAVRDRGRGGERRAGRVRPGGALPGRAPRQPGDGGRGRAAAAAGAAPSAPA